jgi:hypothetical protein
MRRAATTALSRQRQESLKMVIAVRAIHKPIRTWRQFLELETDEQVAL